MASADAQQARNDEAARQERIKKQWANFANVTGREAYQDLMQYADQQRDMYRNYAEEKVMPHPDPNKHEKIPIDNDMVISLLQNGRGINIMRTYILQRVNATGVAQSQNK